MKALIIVDHGSKHEEANLMLEDVAKLLKSKSPADLIIEYAHMELAEPSIEMAIDKCVKLGATEIIVHPYMLSPGRHATKDIPEISLAAIKKYPNLSLQITEPLGISEKIVDVILERAKINTKNTHY